MPEYAKHMVLRTRRRRVRAANVDFMFSAVNMPKDEIRAIEERYAKTETPVVSNNSAHRWTRTCRWWCRRSTPNTSR